MIWIFIKTMKNTTQKKQRKILIVSDEMIADMLSNKKCNSVVTKLFIRGRKVNIYFVFVTQPYFKVPTHLRFRKKLLERI